MSNEVEETELDLPGVEKTAPQNWQTSNLPPHPRNWQPTMVPPRRGRGRPPKDGTLAKSRKNPGDIPYIRPQAQTQAQTREEVDGEEYTNPLISIPKKIADDMHVDSNFAKSSISNILKGVTSVATVPTHKPYVKMTDQEAEAISAPAGRLMVRTYGEERVQEIFKNLELFAIAMAVAAYLIRVYQTYQLEKNNVILARNVTAEYATTQPGNGPLQDRPSPSRNPSNDSGGSGLQPSRSSVSGTDEYATSNTPDATGDDTGSGYDPNAINGGGLFGPSRL